MSRLWVAMVVAALGCGSEDAEGPRTCATLGCPGGSTCNDDVCLADAPGDYLVGVRFIPRAGDARSEWKFPDLRSASTLATDLSFSFSDAVVMHGSVSRDGVSLPAYLELRRDSPVPGRASNLLTATVGRGESFTITVPLVEDIPNEADEGVAYELSVFGTDENDPFPPLRRDVGSAELSQRLEVTLPDAVAIRGVPTLSNGDRRANLRVVALDPLDGRQISSAGFTSAVDTDQTTGLQTGGEFTILVPATTDAFAIRVSEGVNTAAGLPTVLFADLSLPTLSIDPVDGAAVIPLSVLVFPPITQVRLTGTVEGLPRAGGRVAVGQARVRFWSDDLGAPGVADVPGSFERLLESSRVDSPDDSSVYDADFLPAGTYRVEITPPARDDLADLAIGVVEQFVNGPDQGSQSGIALEVPPRVAVGGVIVDGEGRPLEGARVELRGGGDRADMAAARAELWVRTATAFTSTEGAFLALVDPGHYDVVVQPPLSARLPWAIHLDLDVTQDMTLPEPIVVAPGRRLRGVVNDREAGVTVEVWCVTETGASLVCGRATTDAAGRYELLLPAALD